MTYNVFGGTLNLVISVCDMVWYGMVNVNLYSTVVTKSIMC